MKKTLLIFTLIAAAISGFSCSKSDNRHTTTSHGGGTAPSGDKDVVYTGLLPAADAAGVRYTLTLDYDDASHGDYELIQTYLIPDRTHKIGYNDRNTFISEGNFFIETSPAGNGKRYVKLVPDKKFASEPTTYFIIDSDKTLTLVDSELKVSKTPGLNYTLRRAF